MRSVNLAEAKAGLSALLDAVEAGEEVVITRSSSTAGAARSGAMRAAENYPCFAKASQRTHPDGIDEAANVKAGWLRSLARDNANSPLVGPIEIANLLATVIGSFSEPRLPCLPGVLCQSRHY